MMRGMHFGVLVSYCGVYIVRVGSADTLWRIWMSLDDFDFVSGSPGL